MARGFVRCRQLRGNGSLYYAAHVVSQGLVVWADDGWPSLREALEDTRRIAAAFSITSDKGQKHRPWRDVVEEAADL
jgi:hypothetical protein